MKSKLVLSILIGTLVLAACNLGQSPASPSPEPDSRPIDTTTTETSTPIPPTETPLPTQTFTPTPTDEPPTPSPIPTVESLKAKVTAEKLSCRYGPGAVYLYLYALNQTASIKLIGRTDANDWVYVDGKNKCWVHSKYLEIAGDPKSLPIVYPGLKLPVSPYYPGPTWAKATRDGNSVEITWEPVPISPGKYADDTMQQYIIEVWRCENGQIIFETLGTNFPVIKVENDESGCATPSHALVYVQEKHGYGGPVEVPWIPHN